MITSLRSVAGAALYDLPRSLLHLSKPEGWMECTNRADRFETSSEPKGFRICSDVTSSLHVSDVFPWFGRRLFDNCLKSWRFLFANPVPSQQPEFSFIIPHRGTDRLPQLLLTLASIAALQGDVEYIVVEQDVCSRIQLPESVRHLHTPCSPGDDQWRKCFAFNRGAEVAKGKFLVLHDGDILVPNTYLDRLRWHFLRQSHEVVYPQRFLFYLSRQVTESLLQERNSEFSCSAPPEVIKQNWTGGTLAIRRDAYFNIGGFDEEFTGWTGEDREFYDRCQLLNGWFCGYIPFIHLWHPPQPGRITSESRQAAWDFTRLKLMTNREQRVRENRARNFGEPA